MIADNGDLAVLEHEGLQVVEEVFHRQEEVQVVRRSSQNQVAVFPGLRRNVGRVNLGYVVQADVADAEHAQLMSQYAGSPFGVAVNGRERDDDALLFRYVFCPVEIFFNDVLNRFRSAEYDAVKRADDFDRNAGGFLQDFYDLRAEFADDVDVIAASRVEVIFFKVDLVGVYVADGAEHAESVGAEQYLIRNIVGHDNFRPVNHRRFDKREDVLAQLELVAFLDFYIAARHGFAEELFEQLKGLSLSDNFCFRMFFQQRDGRAGMVRFHMLQNEIIQFAAFEQIFYVFNEFVAAALVHRVDNAGHFVVDEIGVVRNAFGNRENPFKNFGAEIVAPHPINAIFNFFYAMHSRLPPYVHSKTLVNR